MSHPWCMVLTSRIISRSDPTSFGPLAGITLRPAPRRDRRSASLTNGTVAAGAGPEREEGLRGFRGLVVVSARNGRAGEGGP